MSQTAINLMMLIIMNWLIFEPVDDDCLKYCLPDANDCPVEDANCMGCPLLDCEIYGNLTFRTDDIVEFHDFSQLMTIYPFRPKVDIRFSDFHYYIAEYWLDPNIAPGRLAHDIDENGLITFIDYAEFMKI